MAKAPARTRRILAGKERRGDRRRRYHRTPETAPRRTCGFRNEGALAECEGAGYRKSKERDFLTDQQYLGFTAKKDSGRYRRTGSMFVYMFFARPRGSSCGSAPTPAVSHNRQHIELETAVAFIRECFHLVTFHC
jgi:hypothetical protein